MHELLLYYFRETVDNKNISSSFITFFHSPFSVHLSLPEVFPKFRVKVFTVSRQAGPDSKASHRRAMADYPSI
jgi:hypothetical protein